MSLVTTADSGQPPPPRRAERAPPRRTTFDAIPNDVVVSIFDRLQHEEPGLAALSYRERRHRRLPRSARWVRETMPLVCRSMRDLYRSQQASPLHETLELDFGGASRTPSDRVSAAWQGVVAWAERHARDVRTLRFVGFSRPRPFSPESLKRLLEVLAPHLDEIDVGGGQLVPVAFWESMRQRVGPVGRLRKLRVRGIDVALPPNRVAFLSRLTRLEELTLCTPSASAGLVAFPSFALASLTNLRRLELKGHGRFTAVPAGISSLRRLESLNVAMCSLVSLPEELGALTRLTALDASYNLRVTAVPAGISSLRRLESLGLANCDLRSLPEELGALSRMTRLDLYENYELGGTDGDYASSSAALRGLTSLRFLDLRHCAMRGDHSFLSQMTALEQFKPGATFVFRSQREPPARQFPPQLPSVTHLDLSSFRLGFVPEAVLSWMPRLRSLNLRENALASLPEDLGRRLPDLRDINLSVNNFTTASRPLRALARAGGASSLERIDLSFNNSLQVEEPLDFLFESMPRLRELVLRRHINQWTPASRANIERFAEGLRDRDPTSVVDFQVGYFF